MDFLSYLFWCRHKRYTWPQTNKFGKTWVTCLDCGKELPYSFSEMKLVSEFEQRTKFRLERVNNE